MAQASTQDFLAIEEIRDGVLVLKDGSIRGVLLCSSLNFALRSDEEQQAIIYQFQGMLNALDFSLQIVIQSRKINITGYLDWLKDLESKQTESLLQQQTQSYREFIEKMTEQGSIMTKSFYVVVPFYLSETQYSTTEDKSMLQKLTGGASVSKKNLSDEELTRMKSQLWQRMEFVALGLRRVGLKVIPLNSEELIELFWSWHHPEESEVGYYPKLPPEVLE